MAIRQLRPAWVLTGLLIQTALPACTNHGAASESASDVGGTATDGVPNGGSNATGRGGTTTGSGGTTKTSQGSGGELSTASTSTATTIGGAPTSATGGVTSAASTSSGGSSGIGADVATGGRSSTGGGAAAGDKTYVGGTASASGGRLSTGGTSALGGKTAAAGASALGGNSASGGASTAGGRSAIGGNSAVGGAVAGGTAGTKASPGSPEMSATGYGKSATGGGNVTAKECANLTALQQAVDNYSGTAGLVLRYTGSFNFASISDPCTQHSLGAQILEIKNTSNVTVLGADGSSANFGIRIVGASSNIIVRNMTIGLTPGGDSSDMISIEGNSTGAPSNVWVDHNTLFSSMVECDGAGDTEFDGMIDIKKGADNITVSYNYMHDHHKVSLNGHTDDTPTNQHVTYHHNLFENVGSRTPLQRFGYSHIFNNYFYKVLVSAINVRMGGCSLVEANYFENVANPVTARDSTEIGYWELRNNNLSSAADVSTGNSFGITWTSGDSGTVNATDWTTTKSYPISLGYSYTPQAFACVHDGLRAVAGAGKGLATLACK